ncbi:cytochrome C oxidase subunit IV family protein [Azoarcus taiwanensis]|uniref:Cytochrome C oxidase subunit IV n=1 Tax=Azoarcus taiwanensis TaxID=666964 RepID=A0A972F7K4_9RHOO|nr:cytochrome C oxidase subunit IV family protein [Azoarcus taiwanensis]NMG03147.1 hypothetical protein [Azoarcus taiwanensis]
MTHPTSTHPSAHGTPRRAFWIWIFLLASTVFAWAMAKTDMGGISIMALLMGLAFAKGAFVILDYMGIRGAPTLWKAITLGWLVVVCLVIVLGYLKGLPA